MMTKSRQPNNRRLIRGVLMLLACALVAAACSAGSDEGSASSTDTATAIPDVESVATVEPTEAPEPTPAPEPTEVPAATAEPVAEPEDEPAAARDMETIEWMDCDGLQCAAIDVPLDYNDPDTDTIEIALAVHRATNADERVGYLLVNPGGPGQSGVDYAFGALAGPGAAFSQEVIERFDIVGFDPRGVANSEPVFACGQPYEQLETLNQIDGLVDTDEEIATGEAAAQLCVESMGPAAGNLHSEFVARDMDEIRRALGAEQINYFGASYGSALGVWYATLFPESVRAMVVDGADNPVDDLSTLEARLADSLVQVEQFEILLRAALEACDSDDCPIYNDGDPTQFYLDTVDKLSLVNDAYNGNQTAGALGLITPLYNEQSWPALWQGLADLANDNPAILVEFASLQIDQDGGASFTAYVNCLDQWVLQPQYDRATQLSDSEAAGDLFEEDFPLLSQIDVEGVDVCPFLDTIAPLALDQPLDGSGVPIVVIGNPSDPATPFSESEELVAETLSNGILVQADHFKHVVYPNNTCVNRVVHRALIDLELPPIGETTVCAAEAPEDQPTIAMSSDQVAETAFQSCLAGARDTDAESDPVRVEEACSAFSERLIDQAGIEALSDIFQGIENPAVDLIPELFVDVMAEFGLPVPGG